MNNEHLKNVLKDRNGLNIVLKTPYLFEDDIVNKTLSNRGVKDIDNFKNLTNVDFTKINNLHNISLIDKLYEQAVCGSRFAVLVDSDVDGISSAAMLVNYFKQAFNIDVLPLIPDTKKHGIKDNFELIFDNLMDFDVLICPDSSSNDSKIITHLENVYKKDILVLDHHIINGEQQENLPIINNQSKLNGSGVNIHYTGAGMVYLMAVYMDRFFKKSYASNLIDLFALGQIADMEDIADLEIRAITLKGLQHVSNSFLQMFYEEYGVKDNSRSLAFTIIPRINAVMRIGTHDDRKALFQALTDKNGSYTIKKRKNINHHFVYQEKEVDVYDYCLNILEKTKQKQDREVKKAVKKIDTLTLDSDNETICLLPEGTHEGLSGLIANKIMGKTGKPTFILNCKQNMYSGSMRIPSQYKDVIPKIESIEENRLCAGHNNAAGVKFHVEDNFRNVISSMNDIFVENDNRKFVDKVFLEDIPTRAEIEEVDCNSNLFGGSVKPPLVGCLGVRLQTSDINLKGNLLKITDSKKKVTITCFNINEKTKKQLEESEELYLNFDFTGELNKNVFLGRTYYQVFTDDIMVSDPLYTEQNILSEIDF